jgi:hypothetical protein
MRTAFRILLRKLKNKKIFQIGQKNGHVSGQTYVPRAVYKSAGVKVGDKPDCWKNHKPTHGLEEVPRIHRAPYVTSKALAYVKTHLI